MPTIYEVLEFGQIRKEIAAFAQSDIGRETSSNLVMLSKGELKNELAILDDDVVLGSLELMRRDLLGLGFHLFHRLQDRG